MTSPKSKEQVVPEEVRNAADEIYFARCDEVSRLAPEFEESEVIDLIARAILAEREREQWQPIETAPTGAKGIAWMMLAYGPEGDQTTGMGMRFHDKFYAASSFYVGGHFESRQYKFQEHEVQPTHWRPIPTPPKGGEE